MKTRMKSNNCGELNLSNLNEEVTLSGWVSTVRDLGGILFIELRDRSGFFQLVANPQINPDVHKAFEKVRSEYVIMVKGKVTKRPEETYNEKYPTGQVEMYPESVEILAESKVLPFILGDDNVSEDIRLKYRYLDIRNEKMLNNLKTRHNIVQAVRNYLNNQEFLEVETPILIKTTPEGARDYLVPSRVQPGKFFALPQSPQIFKQLLMVGGIEKYYQIAKCFRDEDLRADRQPEFTQIDMEMSFVEQQDVIKIVEGLLVDAFKAAGVEIKPPFIQMPWQEAMDRYGSDKPDTRFGLELFDIGDIILESNFEIVKNTLQNGGIVRGIRIPGGAKYSRKDIDDIDTTTAISHATCTTAKDLKAAAIITVTISGFTAGMIARYKPSCPIIACSVSPRICRQMNLYWGVTPLWIPRENSAEDLFDDAIKAAVEAGYIKQGDTVVLTAGLPLGIPGRTNMIRVIEV